MSIVGRKVSVKVPATSANLGPGFDTLGMALAFYDELEVEAVAGDKVVVEVTGEGAGEVATDESNLVVKCIKFTFDRYGQKMPGLRIKAHNVIPHGRGMGSSGAAVVSGIMAAKGLLEGIVEITSTELLDIATELEGHPDNVAPARGKTRPARTPRSSSFTAASRHSNLCPTSRCLPRRPDRFSQNRCRTKMPFSTSRARHFW